MTDRDRQYTALTSGTGLVDAGDRTLIEITGGDRATFLHNMCTNDVKRLGVGEGCEAFLTNAQGKILGHVFIFSGPNSLVLEGASGQTDRLIEHLDRYIIREDVQLQDRSSDWGQLLLGGLQSESHLASICNEPLPESRLGRTSSRLGEISVHIYRTDLVGPVGFMLQCASSEVETVRKAIVDAGAELCGQETFETVRIEFGSPLYGRDISEANLPQELVRDSLAISFTKGCYLGQETVARLDALGHVNQTLCGVCFEGEAVPEAGSELSADGKVVGHVTSATYSPRLKSPLALGYVRRGHNEPGSRLSSPLGAARVVSLPVKADGKE